MSVAEGTYPRGTQLLTPKRPHRELADAADVFPYYAGYSYEWALARLGRLSQDHVVLDPWNGSGTTTRAAATLGAPAIGVDLNPVANAIAKARLVSRKQVEVLRIPPRRQRPAEGSAVDPLNAWLAPHAVARVRDWWAYARSLTQPSAYVLTVALYGSLRAFTRSFEGSNPTWVKRAKKSLDLVDVDWDSLDASVVAHWELTVGKLVAEAEPDRSLILCADAARLPFKSASIHRILGSPPYLTRIDYAVAYSRELALLGVDVARPGLRDALMGTTRIRAGKRDATRSSPLVDQFVARVAAHSSKDSQGYYQKQARQYFDDLVAALTEVSRVAAEGAQADFVVQNSFYKDVQVPLAAICIEVLESQGWELLVLEDFAVPRLVTTMNAGARAYKKGAVQESVISVRRTCAG